LGIDRGLVIIGKAHGRESSDRGLLEPQTAACYSGKWEGEGTFMVFEQVCGFLRDAMSKVPVVPLSSDEKRQITELAERMKEILVSAVERQQHQAQ